MKRQVMFEYEDNVLHPDELMDIARRHSRTITLKSYEQFAEVKQMADDVHKLLGHIYALDREPRASDKGWDLARSETEKAKAVSADHERIRRELDSMTEVVRVSHDDREDDLYLEKGTVLACVHNL